MKSSFNFLDDPIAMSEGQLKLKKSISPLSESTLLDKELEVSDHHCCDLCGTQLRYIMPSKLIESNIFDIHLSNDKSSFSLSSSCQSSNPWSRSPSLFLLRLTENDPSDGTFIIDDHCRSKIVSVCNFFSFIRYYRQGFYDALSNEQLYLNWLQLKRAMMYSRTGSSSYFIVSDVYLLLNKWRKSLSAFQEKSHLSKNEKTTN